MNVVLYTAVNSQPCSMGRCLKHTANVMLSRGVNEHLQGNCELGFVDWHNFFGAGNGLGMLLALISVLM